MREVYQLLTLVILLPFIFREPAEPRIAVATADLESSWADQNILKVEQELPTEDIAKLLTEEEPTVEEEHPLEPAVVTVRPAMEPLEEPKLTALEEADMLLWFVYERTPKADPKDFAWKDRIAAHKAGMSEKDFVIGGAHPQLRLRLAKAVAAMHRAGIDVGITTCFRNDDRQRMVEARRKNLPSLTYHGGSGRGGYGNGRACDLVYIAPTWGARIRKNPLVWAWVDAHSKEFGIGRPFPKGDPMHVTPLTSPEYIAARGSTPRVRVAKKTPPKKRHVKVASMH